MAAQWTWFWLGRSFSTFAGEVTLLTIPTIATLVLNAAPAQIGLLVTIETLAALAGPLFFAGWFDRLPARSILVLADVSRAILVLAIPVAALSGGLSVWLLGVIGFGIGLMRYTGEGAVFVSTPRLVSDDQLERANSQLEIGRRLASTTGPMVAGGLVALLGAVNAPVVESLLLLLSALTLMNISRLPPPEKPTGSERGARWAIVDGIRLLFASSALSTVTSVVAVFNVVVGGAIALTPILMLRELDMTPLMFSIGVGLGAVGGIVGASMSARVIAALGGPATAMPIALIAGSLSTVPIILWPTGNNLTLVVFAATEFVSIASITVFVVANSTLRQRVTSPETTGRTGAAYILITRGGTPVGAAAFGLFAETISVRVCFLLIVVVQVLAGVVLGFRRRTLTSAALLPQPLRDSSN